MKKFGYHLEGTIKEADGRLITENRGSIICHVFGEYRRNVNKERDHRNC